MKAQTGSIEITNIEFDCYDHGSKGLKIHSHINVKNWKDKQFNYTVFFYKGDNGSGGKLLSSGDYKAVDGHVCTWKKLNATYDSSVWEDCWVFIPYSALPHDKGRNHYSLYAVIRKNKEYDWASIAETPFKNFYIDCHEGTTTSNVERNSTQANSSNWKAKWSIEKIDLFLNEITMLSKKNSVQVENIHSNNRLMDISLLVDSDINIGLIIKNNNKITKSQTEDSDPCFLRLNNGNKNLSFIALCQVTKEGDLVLIELTINKILEQCKSSFGDVSKWKMLEKLQADIRNNKYNKIQILSLGEEIIESYTSKSTPIWEIFAEALDLVHDDTDFFQNTKGNSKTNTYTSNNSFSQNNSTALNENEWTYSRNGPTESIKRKQSLELSDGMYMDVITDYYGKLPYMTLTLRGQNSALASIKSGNYNISFPKGLMTLYFSASAHAYKKDGCQYVEFIIPVIQKYSFADDTNDETELVYDLMDYLEKVKYEKISVNDLSIKNTYLSFSSQSTPIWSVLLDALKMMVKQTEFRNRVR